MVNSKFPLLYTGKTCKIININLCFWNSLCDTLHLIVFHNIFYINVTMMMSYICVYVSSTCSTTCGKATSDELWFFMWISLCHLFYYVGCWYMFKVQNGRKQKRAIRFAVLYFFYLLLYYIFIYASYLFYIVVFLQCTVLIF